MFKDAMTEEKARLRKEAKLRRLSLDIVTLSHKIQENIEHWPIFQEAETLLTYAALPDEISLLSLTEKYPHKKWYLPRIASENTLQFHRFIPGDSLAQNIYGIAEPHENAPMFSNDANPPLIFVPALMLDHHGVRLGFGRGYYDRFLSHCHSGTITVCPVPHSLFVGKIPRSGWDIPVKWGITETEIIQISTLNEFAFD